MSIVNSNLNCCALINNFTVDEINCFNRTVCLVSENMVNNSMFCYLLLSELINDFHNKDYRKFISAITGIAFTKKYGRANEFTRIMKDLLRKNNYIILETDLYYEERQPQYKKNGSHHKHFAVMKGYYEHTKEYLVIDEEYQLHVAGSIDNMGVIYSEQLIDEQKIIQLSCNICESELLGEKFIEYSNSSCDIFTYYITKKSNNLVKKLEFDQIIELYKEHIKYMHNILKEYFIELSYHIKQFKTNLNCYKGKYFFYPFPNETMMFMEHYNALSAQNKLLNLLINDREQKGILNKLFSSVLISCQKIKGLLTKSFFSQNEEFCERIICNYFDCLRDDEYKLYEYLLEILDRIQVDTKLLADINSQFGSDLEHTCNQKLCFSDVDVSDGSYKDIFTNEVIHLNIEKYMNNKGISSTLTSRGANLTGGGMSYFFESKLEESINNKFNFRNFRNDNLNDNISCLGQTIVIPKGIYKKFALAGCAEWGNYRDKIKVNYQDGSSEEITIGFTDWVSPPVYDETILLEGKMMDNVKGENIINNSYIARIFSKTYNLDNKLIDNIVLPDCPNIHIFAISLN